MKFRHFVLLSIIAALLTNSAHARYLQQMQQYGYVNSRPPTITAQPVPQRQYADGMNLYQYVRSRPTVAIDPLGLNAKPAKQCTLKGDLFSLVFDGSKLIGGGMNIEAVSGTPVKKTLTYSHHSGGLHIDSYDLEFDYSVDYQDEEDKGPIPAGEWWLNICEEASATGLSFRQQAWRHVHSTKAWGSYSVPLWPEPETETYTRDKIFIHGGSYWGSAGCIDVKSGDATLDKLFAKAYKENACKCCYVPLSVVYSHEKVVKNETWIITWPTGPKI